MSKEHSLRSLVFDLDGTLIDTVPGVALAVRESCAAVGLQAAADLTSLLRAVISQGLGAAYQAAWTCLPDYSRPELSEFITRCEAEYLNAGVAVSVPYGDVRLALERYRQAGVYLSICTNRDHQSTSHLLERHGFDGLFDVVIAREQMPQPKPAPDGLQAISERLGVLPELSLMVGDSALDAAAAAAAGYAFALHRAGYGSSDLVAWPCAHQFGSFTELSHWLGMETLTGAKHV